MGSGLALWRLRGFENRFGVGGLVVWGEKSVVTFGIWGYKSETLLAFCVPELRTLCLRRAPRRFVILLTGGLSNLARQLHNALVVVWESHGRGGLMKPLAPHPLIESAYRCPS